MKVLVNGGLNFSERDGWWAEAYSPQVGWAIGDGLEHGDDPELDAQEAEAMYTLLEQEVVPEFYERSANGMPSRWLERVRESMARLTPEFSASRTIQEYTEKHYLPAASDYKERATDESALGVELLKWRYKIAREWHTVGFGTVQIDTKDDRHFFRVQVLPGNLPLSDLSVQLYADSLPESVLETMTACDQCKDPEGTVTYSAQVAATRPASDYTPRIVPNHPSVSVPLEAGQILWQR
jgi:starch phosphorylase